MSSPLLSLLFLADSQPPPTRGPTSREDAATFMFANHTHHYPHCADPVEAKLSSGVLCDLGNLFA